MSHLIEVAFRGNRKEFFQWSGDTAPPLKAGVIVDADRGEDFGRVHATGELAEKRCNGCAHGCGTAPPSRVALRLATVEEAARDKELDAENDSARRKGMERVKANGLVMKLTDAEWQWDRRKLTFFFTSERRVDFRGLVRDLAALFRARIELKQIGVRDEAKRLSGIGRCGREYCSASWLPDLRPVNLGVAKDQKLSLNPQQISGACGRLMCCLRYEHEFYVQSRRKFPKEGKILVTSIGEEKVLACDIFNERVTLRTAEGDTRVVALEDLRAEIETASAGAAQSMAEGDPEHTHAADTATDIDAGIEASRDTNSFRTVHVSAATTPVTSLPAIADIAGIADIADVAATTLDAVPAPSVTTPIVAGVASVTAPTNDSGAVSDAAVLDDDAADADVSTDIASADTASVDSPSADGEPRRKRRRGRRGGRRLRAAEQRHAGDSDGGDSTSSDSDGNGTAEANDANDANDNDNTDHNR